MRAAREALRRCTPAFLLVPVYLLLVAGAAQASGGGEEEGHSDFLWYTVNFILLVAVLVFFARKPVQGFFSDRRKEIQQQIASASATLSEAESRHAHLQRQLVELENELDEIRRTARLRAESERERILADARASAERIENDARAAVEREVARAREQLRLDASELAIELAATRLQSQIHDGDRDRLIDEFIDRIESGGSAAPGSETSQ